MSAPAAGMSVGTKVGLALVGGLLIGGVAGYGAGRASPGSLGVGGAPRGSYEEGYEAARTKLKDAGIATGGNAEMLEIIGTVTLVESDSFAMTTNAKSPDPLDTRAITAERIVRVTSSTVITRQSPKDAADFQQELEAFYKVGDPGKPFPQPFTIETVAMDDLKAGDVVSVTADHDILVEASFDAVTVEVIPSAAAAASGAVPPPPPPPPKQ